MTESALPGGFVTTVVRVGDTVRRRPAPRAAFVHRLLTLLAQAGWDGAPRFLGIDDRGRETLSFIAGHAAWEARRPASVGCDESLARVATLLREFHDLTAGTELAGDEEVVCHNDLSPKNTVYRDLGAAFIDWDLAAPGRRIHDIAHVCRQYPRLGPTAADVRTAARRIRLICDAYGLADRDGVLDTVLWWQDRCLRGILAAAAAGDPAMVRLCERGATGEILAAHRWVTAHRTEPAAALDQPPVSCGRVVQGN